MKNEQHPKTRYHSCWGKRSKLEKFMILVITALVIIVIVLLALHLRETGEKSSEKCMRPACIRTAADILKIADLTVDPCDDFYRFSCGNFAKYNVLPDYKASIQSFDIVNDMVEGQMKAMFESPIQEQELKPFAIAKMIYQACMNISKIEKEGLSPLKTILKSTGGWPVIEGDQWKPKDFNWQNLSYKFMKLGFAYDIFFSFSVLPDNRNSTRNLLQLDQPFVVSFDKLMRNGFNESIVRSYYDLMVKVVKLFGADNKRAEEEMKEVIELEIALTRITIPQEELRDSTLTTNPMRIRELQEQFPYVDWLKFINHMIHPVKERVKEDVVIVTVPKYFRKLQHVLESQNDRILSNYMYWKAVKRLIKYLNDDIRNLYLDFEKIASGTSQREPRWKQCTGEAVRLNVASAALYVRNFFNEESKATVVEMVKNIRNQFTGILKSVEWMDETTRDHALDKLQAMTVHLAYPEELMDDEKIVKYFENITVSSSDYLELMLNLTVFKNQDEASDLDKPVNKSDWRIHAHSTDVNAYYDESQNSIEFPAGILRGLFFDNDRPQYMNYGAIGYIIGHEITHGFDDQGRQYDKNGNLLDWWQVKTKTAFDAKTKCIVEQYGNFTEPQTGLKVIAEHLGFIKITKGSSNCGNTNCLLSLLVESHGLRFRNVYIYSKSLLQPKYRFLQSVLERVPGVGYFPFTENDNVLDPVDAKPDSTFIFDDVSCDIQNKINGINTQGENIADNGGIKEAYLAYKAWSEEHGKELGLPGLPFTPEQLFWISAGNTWCSIERKEQLKLDIMSGGHAPSYYRVNVPLMNSEYFSQDFECPLGSKMNPAHKCQLW